MSIINHIRKAEPSSVTEPARISREDCYKLILDHSDGNFDDETWTALNQFFDEEFKQTYIEKYGWYAMRLQCPDQEELRDFAAAIEYYLTSHWTRENYPDNEDGFKQALMDALRKFDEGTYRYQHNSGYHFIPLDPFYVEGDECLGRAIFENGCDAEIPKWLEGYINYEKIGRDRRENYKGDFTRQGFFAPIAF